MSGLAPVALKPSAGECVALLGAGGKTRNTLLSRVGAAWKEAITIRASDPLFGQLTVGGNVGFALSAGRSRGPQDLLALSGLDRVARQRATGVDGGLHARIILVRGFATGRALLLDEPFAGLPAVERSGLQQLLRRLLQHTGTPTLLVTSERMELLGCGDRIGVIENGTVARLDLPDAMLASPGSAHAAEALLEAQIFPGRTDEDPYDRDEADIHLACGGTMPARLAETVGPGDPCLVAVRPDQVAFVPLRPGDIGGSAIAVTLVDVRSLGDHLRLRVRLEDGSQIWIRRPAESLKPHDIRRASEPGGGCIAWRASHAIAYPNR